MIPSHYQAVHRFASPIAAALAVAVCALSSTSAMAGGSYVNVGLPGIVVGYAYTVNEKLGLRADAGTTGSYDKTQNVSGVPFQTKAKYDRLGLFGDFFPFSGGFRLTGGLTVNKSSADLQSRFDGNTTVNINGIQVTPASTDYFNTRVKFPDVMPYIGIGYGHQKRESGFGFVADLGVSIGKAKLTTDTNLVGRYGITQADVDAKTQELRDDVGNVSFLPSVSVGLNYRY